jgi:hypothetical protein
MPATKRKYRISNKECRMLKLFCSGENFIIRNSMFDIRYSFREHGKLIILKLPPQKNWLRGRAEISSHSGASAGWADARRRDAGDAGHRRGAATPQMPVRRRAAGRPVLRHAVCYAGRQTIDKPENRPQNVKLFLRGP